MGQLSSCTRRLIHLHNRFADDMKIQSLLQRTSHDEPGTVSRADAAQITIVDVR